MRCFLLAALVGLSLLPVRAQLQLRVERPKTAFLLYAPLEVDVTLNNVSAQSVYLSEMNGKSWLRFLVQRPNGVPVQAGADFLQPPVTLGPGQTVKFKFNLTPYYGIRTPGSYRVTALIRLPGVGGDLTSAPVEVNVVNGRVIWNRQAGDLVTGRQRSYSLITHLAENRTKLYAQIDSTEDNLVYASVPLGDYLETEKPECMIESASIWHILYRSGTASFAYVALDTNGRVLKEENYSNVESRPRLVQQGGRVQVVGGMTANQMKGDTLRSTQPGEVLRPGG